MTPTATMTMEYDALTGAVAELHAGADELDDGRRGLHRSFGDFLDGGWTGRAADSFVAGWDDWAAGVGDVLEALRSIADLVHCYGTGLRDLDGGVRGAVEQLEARLGRPEVDA